jgi:hypothetical protein
MSKDLTATQKITFRSDADRPCGDFDLHRQDFFNGLSFLFLRFSLTPALVIYTSLALGPLYGAIVGGFRRSHSGFCLYQGSYNFLITIRLYFPWCSCLGSWKNLPGISAFLKNLISFMGF